MRKLACNLHLAFVSTYPPRECGIATFTSDLVHAIEDMSPAVRVSVVAISNDDYCYDERVKWEIYQDNRKDYIETAEKLNASDVNLVIIEHEYGIFGGKCRQYVLDFVRSLELPLVTTLHTVLPSPGPEQKQILVELAARSSKLVTMACNTVPVLKKVYGVPENKVQVIHHGVPKRVPAMCEMLKRARGLGRRRVISTFGLLSPGKGIEDGIEAVARVVRDFPDVIYLILGQTHPSVKREQGESYRESLIRKVKELGIEQHVRFVDKYLTKDEIIEYLQLSDVYMTPYLGRDQAVSGTLAYAVGYGKVIVSTAYSYAREMLSNGRGMLVEFNNPAALAEALLYIFRNPEAAKKMEEKTRSLGENIMWDKVAKNYLNMFAEITTSRSSLVVG